MLLIVPPPIASTMKVASADSGIERNTPNVAFTLPRKRRIITPVSTRPSTPSWIRFSIAVFTKTD